MILEKVISVVFLDSLSSTGKMHFCSSNGQFDKFRAAIKNKNEYTTPLAQFIHWPGPGQGDGGHILLDLSSIWH